MKKFLLIILCVAFQGVAAQDVDIRKTIDTFFEGFHSKDTIKMQSVCHAEMVLHSVTVKNDENIFKVEKISEFLKSIASIPSTVRFEEKILSYQIKSDGAIAHVWTPYEFFVNGQPTHSGVNSFQFIKQKDGWKITYIIDTRKKP